MKVTFDEIVQAMIGNTSQLKLSEIVDVISAKNKKDTVKKLKKYAKKYSKK